jgi:hypothetical protein
MVKNSMAAINADAGTVITQAVAIIPPSTGDITQLGHIGKQCRGVLGKIKYGCVLGLLIIYACREFRFSSNIRI